MRKSYFMSIFARRWKWFIFSVEDNTSSLKTESIERNTGLLCVLTLCDGDLAIEALDFNVL